MCAQVAWNVIATSFTGLHRHRTWKVSHATAEFGSGALDRVSLLGIGEALLKFAEGPCFSSHRPLLKDGFPD